MDALFVKDLEAYKRMNPDKTDDDFMKLQIIIKEAMTTPMIDNSINQRKFEEFKQAYTGEPKSDMELLNLYYISLYK